MATRFKHACLPPLVSPTGKPQICLVSRALRLNPLDPEIAYVLCGMAFARLQLGQPEEALALARRARSETPAFGPAHSAEAYALNACGRKTLRLTVCGSGTWR